jgi:hypothetical protein
MVSLVIGAWPGIVKQRKKVERILMMAREQ